MFAVLCRSLFIKYYLTPKLPMLDQLAEGLKLFGVLDLVREHEDEMRHIFTHNASSIVTDDQTIDLFKPFYDDNTQRKEMEINTYKAMCDFVEELHHQGLSLVNTTVHVRKSMHVSI